MMRSNDEDGLLGWLDLALELGGKGGGMTWHPSITSICGDSDVISSSLPQSVCLISLCCTTAERK